MRVSASSGAGVERLGKQCARIALVDSSLLQLSWAVDDWAAYRQERGAAKMPAGLEGQRRIPAQVGGTAGKIHDANRAVPVVWKPGWPDVQDRGYVSCTRLAQRPASGAQFVVRLKRGMHWQVVARRPVPLGRQSGGYLRGDQTVRVAGGPAGEVRVVRSQLPDYRWVWGITDRCDLTAASVARLSKERGKIENWWEWITGRRKLKRPVGERANALPLHLIAAVVTDLLWRVFKALGHCPASLYEFVTRCQELSLGRLADVAEGALRHALERIRQHFSQLPLLSPMPLSLRVSYGTGLGNGIDRLIRCAPEKGHQRFDANGIDRGWGGKRAYRCDNE